MNRRKMRNRNRQESFLEKIKEGTLQYGLLWYVCRSLLSFLKAAGRLLVFRSKKKLKSPLKKVYQKWEEEWLSDEKETEKAKEDPFFLLFKYDYEFTCMKAKKNRDKNFRMKFICILPFIIVTILYLGGVIAYNVNIYLETKTFSDFIESADWSISIYGTAFYLAALLVTYIITKWLDVKQYQETWSRHEEHRYAVEMEMLKYIYYRDEYYFDDRKQKFVGNIIKTWDDNMNKFLENMKHEKNMKIDDIWKHIKGEKD